jgi:hypothetical protein
MDKGQDFVEPRSHLVGIADRTGMSRSQLSWKRLAQSGGSARASATQKSADLRSGYQGLGSLSFSRQNLLPSKGSSELPDVQPNQDLQVAAPLDAGRLAL